jgi:hypothetical protein
MYTYYVLQYMNKIITLISHNSVPTWDALKGEAPERHMFSYELQGYELEIYIQRFMFNCEF